MQSLRQLHGCFDIDTGQHPIPSDICIDDSFDTVIFILLSKVDDIMSGEFRPAINGNFAILCVQTNDDMPRKRIACFMQESRAFDSCGADDDIAHSVVQVTLYPIQVSNTSPKLDRYVSAYLLDDRPDRTFVDRLAGKCAVQVNQMQASPALINPMSRHCSGIFRENCSVFHDALLQPYTVTVLQVDGRYDQHDVFNNS